MGINNDNRNPRDKLELIETAHLTSLLFAVYLRAFVCEIFLDRLIKLSYNFGVSQLSTRADIQAISRSVQITRHGSSITTPPYASSQHLR